MERHPGYIDPRDKEPEATLYKRVRVDCKPVPKSTDVDLIVVLNAHVDDNWSAFLEKEASLVGPVTAWDMQISTRVNEDSIESTVEALDAAIENANTEYRLRVLPELKERYEARQAEKNAERARKQSISERIAKLNGQ
ncbi:hypothetical protein GS498_19815 [Rhodococcus hoagii]|nr:hypothetical protein [Prescottella equi]